MNRIKSHSQLEHANYLIQSEKGFKHFSGKKRKKKAHKFNPNKTELFEGSFFWGVKLTPRPNSSPPPTPHTHTHTHTHTHVHTQGNVKRSKKSMKIYWRRKSSCLLNKLRNFNEVFKKDVTYDDIKSHKKEGFHDNFR